MNSEAKALSIQRQESSESSTLFQQLKPHVELIAAIFSGALIAAGWIFTKLDFETASFPLFSLAFIIGGYAKAKEGIEETIKNRELNVEMLMVLAAIGSAIIGYWTEGAILIFIFAMSGALETYTMNKSQREISSLMEMQPEEAWLIRDNEEEKVHVSTLSIHDLILVKPGERIPSDGKITKGRSTIDEAAITGESIPVSKSTNDEVFAGTVNINGAITVEITKSNDETLFQKIIQLVQSAQSEKSPSQLFIEKFEGTYVKIVLLVVLVMMIAPHFLFAWSWMETLYRAMVLLVVASPCALVASIMPATLSAISNGAKHGILFKGGIHLENASNIRAIAFDKTGTLTKGKPEVTNILVADNWTEKDVLLVASSIENQSNHPLAQSIVQFAKKKHEIVLSTPDHIEDVSGWGIRADFQGSEWKIGKADFVGQEKATAFQNGAYKKLASEGKTIVFIQNEETIVGLIALKDVVREDAKKALALLKAEGIYTIMLTGDSEKTASVIAKEIGIDEYIAECLPETKVIELKKKMDEYGVIAMVGDGINDAPALATANVGIAMGEGTDVALETADVVLMKNDLTRIAEAIKLSKRMQKIVKQNVIFSISVIMLLIISNFLQVLDLPLGVIGHEGSTILVILNGLRLLKS
jgi:Cd2+/Zn2+-exporting ATPase